MWQQMHEEVATGKYRDLTGNKVEPAGTFLSPCGYLGCSPDGIIYEDKEEASNDKGILEIKCPWNSWAHFVVWTNVDCKIFHVEKDPLWEDNFVPMLSDFYLNDSRPPPVMYMEFEIVEKV